MEAVRPGYFLEFLVGRAIPWQQVAIDQRDSIPVDVHGFSGLCLRGGTMSVNHSLGWIDPVCGLIRSSIERHSGDWPLPRQSTNEQSAWRKGVTDGPQELVDLPTTTQTQIKIMKNVERRLLRMR